jgi:hypothetical protein
VFLSFLEYLVSIVDKWFFWVGIVFLVPELLKKIPKCRKWAERLPHKLFWVLGGICVLIATFQAWHDERNKVLGQVTYMTLTAGRDQVPSHIEFTAGTAPYLAFIELNDGINPAVDVINGAALEIQDFSESVAPNFSGSPEIEDALFKKLKSRQWDGPKRTFEPHEQTVLFANLGRTLTEEEANGLSNHTKMIYLLSFVDWTDGAGRHEKQMCQWIANPADGQTLWSAGCRTHNGLVSMGN